MRSRAQDGLHVAFGAAGGDDPRPHPAGESDGHRPARARAALHQDGAPLYGTHRVNGAVCDDAGDAEAGAMLERHRLRQRAPAPQGLRCTRRGAKRAVVLGPVAPDATPDPLL